jgi:FkbM family methyltransferase
MLDSETIQPIQSLNDLYRYHLTPRSIVKQVMPLGISEYIQWRRRLRKVSSGGQNFNVAAFSQQWRSALSISRIECIPPEIRSSLRTIVDVGANDGQWANALLKFTKQPQRMELFEPNPDVYRILASTVGRKPFAGLHNLALGDKPGTIALNITRSSVFSSVLPPTTALLANYGTSSEVVRTVDVPVSTLDAELAAVPSIDLLKLDVQGYERRVLAGAKEILSRTRSLLIETNYTSHYESDDDFESLSHVLITRYGFRLWSISSPSNGTTGQALWADALFLPQNTFQQLTLSRPTS